MTTKRPLERIKKLDLVLKSELATLTGARASTIKYHSELGLIPFEQKGERLAKYYSRVEAGRRIKEILKMREQGKSIPEIVAHFIKK